MKNMPYDPIKGQGQGHESPQVAKIANFSAGYQKTNGDMTLQDNI